MFRVCLEALTWVRDVDRRMMRFAACACLHVMRVKTAGAFGTWKGKVRQVRVGEGRRPGMRLLLEEPAPTAQGAPFLRAVTFHRSIFRLTEFQLFVGGSKRCESRHGVNAMLL